MPTGMTSSARSTREANRSAVAAELDSLEARKLELEARIASDPPPPVRIHPNVAEIYRNKIENLREALDRDDARNEAAEIMRGLIDEIRLVPIDGKIEIYLVGNLAAILELCAKKNPGSIRAGAQLTVVAGARNHRELTLPPIAI